MGGLRTIFLAFAALLLAMPAGAMPSGDTQLRTFATCTGRLSALMEHQWMFDGPGSEQTARARAQMVDILDAMMPEGRGRDVLAWRVEAKMAHAMLLTRAVFAQDRAEARWAAQTADRLTAECRAFLLS